MADQRTIDILLRILDDQASVAKTLTGVTSITEALDALRAKTIETAAQTIEINRFNAALSDPAVAKQVDTLNMVLQKADNAAKNLSENLSKAGTSYQTAQARLQGYLDEVENELRLEEQVQEARDRAFATQQEQAQAKVKGIFDEIEAEQSFLDKIKEVQAAREEAELGAATRRGYGNQGGLIGPAEAEDEGGGASVGSAFAIGHGLSVAGHAFGAPALREAGGLVYIEESLRRVGPLFTELNAKLLETGGIAPALTEALAAANVPMAGLVATAGPLALGAGAVTAAFLVLQHQLNESKDAVDQGIDQLDRFYKEIGKPRTSNQLQEDLNNLEQTKGDQQKRFALQGGKIQDALQEAAGMGLQGAIKLLLDSGYNDLVASNLKLKDEMKGTQAQIDATTAALGNNRTATADRMKANEEEVAFSLHVNDLKRDGTSKQVQAEIDGLNNRVTGNQVLLTELGKMDQTEAQVKTRTAELTAENIKYEGQLKTLTESTLAAVKAREAEAAANKAKVDAIENQLQLDQKFAADDKLTLKAVQEKLANLQREGALQQAAADQLKDLNSTLDKNSDEYQKNEQAIKAHEQAAQNDRDEIKHLTDVSIPAAEATEYLSEGIKNLKKSLEDAAKEGAKQAGRIGDAIAGYHKAQADAAVADANYVANAKLKEKQAEEALTKGSIEDVYERSRITLEESRKEVDIRRDTADKIDDINLKLYEKQYQVGIDYSRKLADDQTKASDDLAKLLREGQYQQQEDQIDHQARLKQLRERDVVEDTQNLLDRNFKALYLAGLHKDQEAKKEEDDFAKKEQQQARHLQQQESELAIHLQQERAQDQVNYERKMEDAQRNTANEIVQADIAEKRKIELAQQAEQQKLTDLTTSENHKIQLLRHNMDNELILYRQQERQRLEIAKETQKAIVDDALAQIAKIVKQNNALNIGLGLLGGGVGALHNLHIFDSGGSFGGNEPFLKGNISEDIKINGRGFNVGGSALVWPLQSGSVTPDKSKGAFAPTINVYPAPGTDGAQIANQIMDQFEAVMG